VFITLKKEVPLQPLDVIFTLAVIAFVITFAGFLYLCLTERKK